jgi:hypothetical protein
MPPYAAIAMLLRTRREPLDSLDAPGFSGGRASFGMREIVMANTTRITFVLSLLALGCGGTQAPAASAATPTKAASENGPLNVVTKRGSGSIAATVGAAGGTLELEEGPRVVIPAGAVKGGQEFVLKVAAKTTAFSNKESERALGPTFSFSPSVDGDGTPVEVSVPLDSLPKGWGEPSIAYEVEEGTEISYGEDSTRTKWQYERAVAGAGRIVAKLGTLNGLRMQFVLTNLDSQ